MQSPIQKSEAITSMFMENDIELYKVKFVLSLTSDYLRIFEYFFVHVM